MRRIFTPVGNSVNRSVCRSRRLLTVLSLEGVVVAVCTFGLINPAVAQTLNPCAGINDILFRNGKIITVDEDDSVATSLRIRGNTIVAVGDVAGEPGLCTQVIDLLGRTVIPGFIDHHNHWLGRATRPGHHVAELDTAFSISEVLSLLQKKSQQLPVFDPNTPGEEITADDFLTSIGGFDTAQFAEGRLPTSDELDSIDHPVFLSLQFDGPSQTNSAGKRYFEARGVTVGPADVVATPLPVANGVAGPVTLADGEIAQGTGTATLAARGALNSEHDFDAKKRGTVETMVWSVSLGLTTNMDQSGGSRAFEPYLALFNEGKVITRLRIAVGAPDAAVAGMPDRVEPPELAVPKLAVVARNAFPNFGNDMVRIQQVAENVVVMGDVFGRVPIPSNYDEAARVIAKYGWSYQQHSIPVEEVRNYLTIWEEINNEYPIGELRWSLTHLFDIGTDELDRLDALGAGAALESHKYTTHVPEYVNGAPPYRTAFEHAVHAGAGSDGGNVTTINPWTSLYFMTTGKNTRGDQVLSNDEEDGETVTRRQALRMYTIDSAWFSFDDERLGSLEPGKLADLAVLSDDFDSVADEDLRSVKSVLTVVDGRIVYSDSSLIACRNSDADGVWYPAERDDLCVVN